MNLDQLFDKAKHEAPLMDMAQIQALLETPLPSTSMPKKTYGKALFVVTTTIACFVLGALLFFSKANKPQITQAQVGVTETKPINLLDVENIETKILADNTAVGAVFGTGALKKNIENNTQVTESEVVATYKMAVSQSYFNIAIPHIKTKEVVFNGKDSSSRFRLFGDSIHFQQDIKAPHIELRQAQYAYINDEENIKIRYLDLEAIDLKKIGITLSEKGMFYNNVTPEIGKLQLFFEETLDLRKHSGAQTYTPTYSAALDEKIPAVERNTTESSLGFYPYLTTDTKGSQILSYMFDKTQDKSGFYALQGENVFKDAVLRDKLNKLIPIRVRLKEHEILLWFTLNPAFLAALPKHLAADITQELNLVNSKNSASKCQFFEVCRSNFNLINKVNTFPNPVNDDTMFTEFELSVSMSIRVALHDMEGNEVRELQPYTEWPRGKNKTTLNLSLLPNGMYILAFYNGSTYATQRILIQR